MESTNENISPDVTLTLTHILLHYDDLSTNDLTFDLSIRHCLPFCYCWLSCCLPNENVHSSKWEIQFEPMKTQNKTNKQVINNNDQFIFTSKTSDKWLCWKLFSCIIEMLLCVCVGDLGQFRIFIYKFYANESQRKQTKNTTELMRYTCNRTQPFVCFIKCTDANTFQMISFEIFSSKII